MSRCVKKTLRATFLSPNFALLMISAGQAPNIDVASIHQDVLAQVTTSMTSSDNWAWD